MKFKAFRKWLFGRRLNLLDLILIAGSVSFIKDHEMGIISGALVIALAVLVSTAAEMTFAPNPNDPNASW